MITRTDLGWWLDLEPELDWQFAVTYAEGAPHEYVAFPRTGGLDERDYARAAHVIQTFGEPMKFYKRTRIYLTTPMGWKHWTMDRDLDQAALVNRGRVEHVYGVQNMPRTRSEFKSAYDGYASAWDRSHAMTEAEQDQVADLIRRSFGDRLGRTLDVGCGTGWPVTAGLAEPVRYVGIDPSTAMLNALVAKHPTLAGVHAMTWADAAKQRVLCGTAYDAVLALGGSASYLSPLELSELRTRSKRGVLLMHYAPDQQPITDDLDPRSAAASLAAASDVATEQTAVGRFIVSFVPAHPAESAPLPVSPPR
ncbi:hypothetical protein [uncultured Amnibacterium sp.]|uniref:hypothetical protein n=1 Tax=uncultured Amnibacterium sp. TaxID=1631851 RepID=UPI0035C999A2